MLLQQKKDIIGCPNWFNSHGGRDRVLLLRFCNTVNKPFLYIVNHSFATTY